MSLAAPVVPEAVASPRHRPIAVELALVALLALAMLLPGVWQYSLVDPWETHYGEVARRMLQDHDWVHTSWQNEGFRSKPVLTFWLMAASMKTLGLADGGGYSGEMVSSGAVMLAIRLPFVLFGVLGLCAMWWMLTRMVSRRVAYLALLVLGTTPFYLFVARQGITDITLIGSMMGAIAMFAVANEVGDEPVRPLGSLGRRRPWVIDHRHLFVLLIGGFVLAQAIYYVLYFGDQPRLTGLRMAGWLAGWLISGPMLVGLAVLASLELPGPAMRSVRQVLYWFVYGLPIALTCLASRAVRGGFQVPPEDDAEVKPVTTSRQVYMLWFWGFLGISVLGKGLPALGIVGVVCFFYVALLDRWHAFWRDRYELVRGLAILLLIAAPWHVAMYFQEGRRFLQEYFVTHLWNRAAVGVFGERGTFDFYLSQIGYGMFVWAALVPAALAALALRTRTSSSEGRARFLVATWAVTSIAFFALVQTKFHHYILPAIPSLAIAIGFWLDDVLAGRARRLGTIAVVGAGIVLLIANDMMGEQKQWIEMFVFRYDRPWPSLPPWEVDVSDGFLAIGVAGAIALLLLAVRRLARLGVVAVCGVALGMGLWAIHAYMPVAGQHWGMRDAVHDYYRGREIHGMRLVYHGGRQLAADWARGDDVRDTWTIRTLVPDHVQEGQPVVLRITVKSADDRRTEHDLRLVGAIERVDADAAELRVRLPRSEVARLAPIVRAGRQGPRSSRAPIRIVDGDRLIAWQLYWRGENFWSGDEIWGRLPELQTAFKDTDNVKFLKYLKDPELCPEGRRYWVLTEAGRIANLKTILPTARAKETFRIENTSSNKFTLVSFVL